MSHGIGGCVLCGDEIGDRVMALIEWSEPIGRDIWSYVPRCVDRAACRERVERVLEEPWPVNDGTPPPTPRAAVPTAPPEPEPAEEEGPAWLRG